MKTLLSFLIISLGILFSNTFSISKSKSLHGGRCTGSANCSACYNCSRCGHCSSGGSCGVCRGSSSGRNFYSTPKKKYKTSYRSNSTNSNSFYSSAKNVKTKKANTPIVKYYNANGEVIVKTITDVTNIRKKASIKAEIIEKVGKGSSLILLRNSGTWLKIKVKKSGKIGFVYFKNVR